MKIKLKENKTEEVGVLIFSMLDILGKVGIPLNGTARRLERMAMACLAVGDIRTNFQEAKSADDDFFLTSRELLLMKMRTMASIYLLVHMMTFGAKT